MRRSFRILPLCLLLAGAVAAGQTVRLPATADVWLSDANAQERDGAGGKLDRFKIKSIQEMAAIRFDAAPAAGREVLSARLLLHLADSYKLRYVRVSTVNGDWVEGGATRPYTPGDGATFNHADAATRRPWAWSGSQFCDVIMGSGNSLACWAERKTLDHDWISVELTSEMVYALTTGDTDGLAVMEGGGPRFINHMVHSVQSGRFAPYVEVELGRRLASPPQRPAVSARPAPHRAGHDTGAVEVTIHPDPAVFCWRVSLDGKPVERWRVPHPSATGPTVFPLEDLPPEAKVRLEVVAVARGGLASPPAALEATSSPRLPQMHLPQAGFLSSRGVPPEVAGKMRVWAAPTLAKIDPISGKPMFDDAGAAAQKGRRVWDVTKANAVWDGQCVRLTGARGAYVSFQVVVENLSDEPLTGVTIVAEPLAGTGGASIGAGQIELLRNWYALNRANRHQPAYCVPVPPGGRIDVPDTQRNLLGQKNQGLTVDVYVPKDARAGTYKGGLRVGELTLPIELEVYDFALPDRLSFWPELNAYRIPPDAVDHYRLAHQHRCVFNPWVHTPKTAGTGKDIRIDWERYDQQVGPLLSGEAFADCRRAGAPVECMYLPFFDSWPTPLTKETYDYQGAWPGRNGDAREIAEHYFLAPYIGDGLSRDYKDAFAAAAGQFIEHFAEKGWNRTEMQCFFGGKNTHRIRYGSNMWWTTDEPYHWDDWLALQFFCRSWTGARGKADPARWAARADISRPQWQGKVLDGIVDTVYFGAGAFNSPAMARRCRLLARETGLKLMTYGSVNRDDASNTQTVAWMLHAWLNGAGGVLPWQILGSAGALDLNDRGISGGNALLAPGKRFGVPVVADLRLKALREGQQLIEYLTIAAERLRLNREQMRAMVEEALPLSADTAAGAGAYNADSGRYPTLRAWRIARLRKELAEMIVKASP